MTDEAQTEIGVEKPVAKFVDEGGRSKLVTLEYPVEFDGKLWTEVEVRRVTGGEMDAYMKAIQADGNTTPPRGWTSQTTPRRRIRSSRGRASPRAGRNWPPRSRECRKP